MPKDAERASQLMDVFYEDQMPGLQWGVPFRSGAFLPRSRCEANIGASGNASKCSICGALIERKASRRARAKKCKVDHFLRGSPRSGGRGRSGRPRAGER